MGIRPRLRHPATASTRARGLINDLAAAARHALSLGFFRLPLLPPCITPLLSTQTSHKMSEMTPERFYAIITKTAREFDEAERTGKPIPKDVENGQFGG